MIFDAISYMVLAFASAVVSVFMLATGRIFGSVVILFVCGVFCLAFLFQARRWRHEHHQSLWGAIHQWVWNMRTKSGDEVPFPTRQNTRGYALPGHLTKGVALSEYSFSGPLSSWKSGAALEDCDLPNGIDIGSLWAKNCRLYGGSSRSDSVSGMTPAIVEVHGPSKIDGLTVKDGCVGIIKLHDRFDASNIHVNSLNSTIKGDVQTTIERSDISQVSLRCGINTIRDSKIGSLSLSQGTWANIEGDSHIHTLIVTDGNHGLSIADSARVDLIVVTDGNDDFLDLDAIKGPTVVVLSKTDVINSDDLRDDLFLWGKRGSEDVILRANAIRQAMEYGMSGRNRSAFDYLLSIDALPLDDEDRDVDQGMVEAATLMFSALEV